MLAQAKRCVGDLLIQIVRTSINQRLINDSETILISTEQGRGADFLRAVIQRVLSASVVVDGQTVGAIDQGLLVLLAVGQGDDHADLDYMVGKVSGLRVFEDAEGKMNLSVQEIQGSVLVVSQFTLYGDVRRGKRPSFTDAAPPAVADQLYQEFCGSLIDLGIPVQRGVFQADMKVSLVNDGPVTILLDSKKLF